MGKATDLSEAEGRAREQDLADYKRHIGPKPENIEEYDFRRGWEYCLGRFGRDKGEEWEVKVRKCAWNEEEDADKGMD